MLILTTLYFVPAC